MARTRASIAVTIWADPDWRALPALAKYLYLLLLSQAKLTLAGALDLKVVRWSEMAPDTSTAVIEEALDALEAARYIATDRETDELVVRTFVKHDVGNNRNSQKGVWTAWQGIESPFLRRFVVANVPDAVWDNPEVTAPEEALVMRSEPLPEHPLRQVSEQPSEQSIEPPIPSPCPPPAPTTAAVLDQAAVLLGLAEADRRGAAEIGEPMRYAKSCVPRMLGLHKAAWRTYLEQFPGATAEDLAALVLRPKPRAVPAFTDHTEQTAAAAAARYEATERRKRGETCPECDDRGHVFDEEANAARSCSTCRRSA